MIPIVVKKGKSRPRARAKSYIVYVPIETDPTFGNEAIAWLVDQGFTYEKDFDFDMNGGVLGYCTFVFKSKKAAIWTALVWT